VLLLIIFVLCFVGITIVGATASMGMTATENAAERQPLMNAECVVPAEPAAPRTFAQAARWTVLEPVTALKQLMSAACAGVTQALALDARTSLLATTMLRHSFLEHVCTRQQRGTRALEGAFSATNQIVRGHAADLCPLTSAASAAVSATPAFHALIRQPAITMRRCTILPTPTFARIPTISLIATETASLTLIAAALAVGLWSMTLVGCAEATAPTAQGVTTLTPATMPLLLLRQMTLCARTDVRALRHAWTTTPASNTVMPTEPVSTDSFHLQQQEQKPPSIVGASAIWVMIALDFAAVLRRWMLAVYVEAIVRMTAPEHVVELRSLMPAAFAMATAPSALAAWTPRPVILWKPPLSTMKTLAFTRPCTRVAKTNAKLTSTTLTTATASALLT